MLRVLMIGTGGWGSVWCRSTLPYGVKNGWIQAVGAMDQNADHLIHAKEGLGLSKARLYTDVKEALDRERPDACIIAAAPCAHEELALAAMKAGAHVLCEKPVTENPESLVRLMRLTEETKTKFGVTFSHRYTKHIRTLLDEIRSGRYGKLGSLTMNFTIREGNPLPARQRGVENLLLNECSIHHFDFLQEMAGAPCESVYVQRWNPDYTSQVKNGGLCFAILKYKNGVRVCYEANLCSANSLHAWSHDFIRAELSDAVLVLDGEMLYCYKRSAPAQLNCSCMGERIPVTDMEGGIQGNQYLLKQFAKWIEGGKPMETRLENAFRSQMTVFAADESAKIGLPVNLDEFVKRWKIN